MNYREVFSFNHLYHSALKCFKGVGWKKEVQLYKNALSINLISLQEKLYSFSYKSQGFYEFDINERGKERHIMAVYLEERIVQKCLCDYYLIPTLSKTFIYDNGASQKGRGSSFAIGRLVAHLQHYYREHGCEGYYLKFDLTHYFENINHNILKQKLTRYLVDKDLRALTFSFIDNCGERGLGLGSQVSQICSLFYLSSLDHYIKEKLHIRYYVRYMDDAVLIFNDKEYLKKCLNEIREKCKELDVIINDKKTQIIKLSKGINFLKRRFLLTETGKVLKFVNKKNYNDIVRKLRKKPLPEIYQSWQGAYKGYNNYWRVYNIKREFHF